MTVLNYKIIWTVRWGWWWVKLYKAINILDYGNTSFSHLSLKQKLYTRDRNTLISLANDKVQAQAFINRYMMDKLAKNNH